MMLILTYRLMYKNLIFFSNENNILVIPKYCQMNRPEIGISRECVICKKFSGLGVECVECFCNYDGHENYDTIIERSNLCIFCYLERERGLKYFCGTCTDGFCNWFSNSSDISKTYIGKFVDKVNGRVFICSSNPRDYIWPGIVTLCENKISYSKPESIYFNTDIGDIDYDNCIDKISELLDELKIKLDSYVQITIPGYHKSARANI